MLRGYLRDCHIGDLSPTQADKAPAGTYPAGVFLCPLTGPPSSINPVNEAAPWPAPIAPNLPARWPWPVGTGHGIRVTVSGSPVTGPQSPNLDRWPWPPATGPSDAQRVVIARAARPVDRG